MDVFGKFCPSAYHAVDPQQVQDACTQAINAIFENIETVTIGSGNELVSRRCRLIIYSGILNDDGADLLRGCLEKILGDVPIDIISSGGNTPVVRVDAELRIEKLLAVHAA